MLIVPDPVDHRLQVFNKFTKEKKNYLKTINIINKNKIFNDAYLSINGNESLAIYGDISCEWLRRGNLLRLVVVRSPAPPQIQ